MKQRMTTPSEHWHIRTSRSRQSRANSFIGAYSTWIPTNGPENDQTRRASAHMSGKEFRLAEEIRYIHRRSGEHDGRIVTIGRLILFSTGIGDAWLLDPADCLAARLARNGDPESIHFEETDTASVVTIPAYPADRIRELG